MQDVSETLPMAAATDVAGPSRALALTALPSRLPWAAELGGGETRESLVPEVIRSCRPHLQGTYSHRPDRRLSWILRFLDDRSALHHKSNGLHGRDVDCRISGDGDDVGQRA